MKRAGAMREARVSGNGRNLLAALAAVLPLACSAMAMAGEQAITVAGQQAYLNVPPGARAGVVLVSGSGGLHPQDLFMRTRHRFEAEGVATLMVSFQSKLGPAVQELRRHVPRVTLAGMSAGTVSVSRAIRNGARADGLVLVSGFLMPGSAPNSVQALVGSPGALPPTLVIHNRQEACNKTPASAVEPFIAWSGGKARATWIDSGMAGGNICGPMHYHGFPGSEAQVVSSIARFAASR